MLQSVLALLLALFLVSPAAGAQQADVARFLAAAGPAPVWTTPRLEALAMAFETLSDDGLEPAAYALATIRRFAHTPPANAAERICLESIASQAWLDALHDLANGRLAPEAADRMWRIDEAPPAAAESLIARAAAGLDDPVAALERARPGYAAYRALRAAHARLLAIAADEPPPLPAGRSLREGDAGARVAALSARLAWLGHAVAVQHAHFDAALTAAVQTFQRDHALDPDGVVGPLTRAALNLDAHQRITRVRANLERWRQLAHDLRATQLRVDTGAATIALVRDGEVEWTSRVQVGRRDRPTPLLRSEVDRLTFNPPWYVPPTILHRDKLPAIRDDPAVLEESRLRVLDMDGTSLDPATIDWANPGAIRLRQDPGPHNALGQVAIRFPNPFFVYLHDTPSQGLFASWQRTFSSGCVRVERAMELAEALLGIDADAADIARWLASPRTREVPLGTPVSILITYVGAAVEDGRLQLRPDVYGHDAALATALEASFEPAPRHTCTP